MSTLPTRILVTGSAGYLGCALHLTLPSAYHDLWHELCDRGRSQEERAAARESKRQKKLAQGGYQGLAG